MVVIVFVCTLLHMLSRYPIIQPSHITSRTPLVHTSSRIPLSHITSHTPLLHTSSFLYHSLLTTFLNPLFSPSYLLSPPPPPPPLSLNPISVRHPPSLSPVHHLSILLLSGENLERLATLSSVLPKSQSNSTDSLTRLTMQGQGLGSAQVSGQGSAPASGHGLASSSRGSGGPTASMTSASSSTANKRKLVHPKVNRDTMNQSLTHLQTYVLTYLFTLTLLSFLSQIIAQPYFNSSLIAFNIQTNTQ